MDFRTGGEHCTFPVAVVNRSLARARHWTWLSSPSKRLQHKPIFHKLRLGCLEP